MENITSLIKEEHSKLNKQWTQFVEEYKIDRLKSGLIFDSFKWNLQKHFQMEELSVYELSQSIKGEEVGTIFDLMEDHGALRSLLLEIEKHLGVGEDISPKIQEFKETFDKHEHFEDNNFYPMLDEYLNDNQKKMILIKIKEKIREKDNSKSNNIGL